MALATGSIFAASAFPSIFPNISAMEETAFIPASESFSKAGCSLFDIVSFSPSMACPTVLYDVAISVNFLDVPAADIALKNFSVDTVPACTFLIKSCVDIPICFATAEIPAGVCSTISLKSCHATVGFAAIWVACWESVFMACLGFSAAAANPPKPFTSFVVFFVPTAASCA